MTYDYRRPQATASRLIKKYGQKAKLEHTGPGAAPDPAARPWDPGSGAVSQVVASYPVLVVITDYSDRERMGGVVDVAARKALMSVEGLPSGLVIGTGWRLKVGKITYNVKPPVTTYDPGGTVLAYEFQVLA